MNWQEVVRNLNAQTKWYSEQAAEWSMSSGYQERVRQYRQSADIASILASAFTAGLLDKSPE